MSSLPTFALGCFALPTRAPHESLCLASSFDDLHLQHWIKRHESLEKTSLNGQKQQFIYVFKIDGVSFDSVVDADLTNTSVYKVGRTNDPDRRRREWRSQCATQVHTWFDPVPVSNYVEVERLVHAQLEKTCVARPRKTCGDCGRVHQEVFIVVEEPDVVKKLQALIVEQDLSVS
ncbi:hypothetical protein V5O48_014889 [Marasmius crinis-equi]|uniref:Bacteriophage T5 Orf172 DNA-binding domain-containing protein n=1 Tax=Marasmius crinis-equi TaxID=585013 RepID=A0ABR3EW26_9AGAR